MSLIIYTVQIVTVDTNNTINLWHHSSVLNYLRKNMKKLGKQKYWIKIQFEKK